MKTSKFIAPLSDLAPEIFTVQKPARYVGGELGAHRPISPEDRRYRFALCFPDLYEIGMSNNAIRILYNDVQKLAEKIVCERVFAVAPDFEALLAKRGMPLFTLESGIPLHACDLIGFSIGYELAATNILQVLDRGGIPLSRSLRSEEDPIVIAGGPAVTNPLPFSDFLDAVFIGEAEASFYATLEKLSDAKSSGAPRSELLALIADNKSFWLPSSTSTGKPRTGLRAVYSNFSESRASTAYPVPVLPTVQSHGTVEIMRGCPNGCRFCHAGYFYRPQRCKPMEGVEKEVEQLIRDGGYSEITLSSLSSGDYPGILELFGRLNNRWKDHYTSFQLPSLKVDTFTLPLLESLSEVRKAGLTFAVETPDEAWQRSINKEVSADKIIQILQEAAQKGFKTAKFYFMIGLPVPGKGKGEGEAIVDFLTLIASKTRIRLSVSIGTFIPKPHTPYEREQQISEQDALNAIYYIKDSLRPIKSLSINYHSPFTANLEGILSRGDQRVGELIRAAYEKGARLDAWDEYLDVELWRSLLNDYEGRLGFKALDLYLAGRKEEDELPWKSVKLFISDAYLEKEAERSRNSILTQACEDDCDHLCGSCNDSSKLVSNYIQPEPAYASVPMRGAELLKAGVLSVAPQDDRVPMTEKSTEANWRLVMEFEKTGNAVLFPLHAIGDVFTRAFRMVDLPVSYTEGFNPSPRMEFTAPLSLGVASKSEIVAVWVEGSFTLENPDLLKTMLNRAIPSGIFIKNLAIGKSRSQGKNTIGSIACGSIIEIEVVETKNTAAIAKAIEAADIGAIDVSDNCICVDMKSDRNLWKIIGQAFPDVLPSSIARITKIQSRGKDPVSDLAIPLFGLL